MKSTMALYATYGAHRKLHRVVLYFNHEKDWTRKQRAAHGNTGKALCTHPMTTRADALCNAFPYSACFLCYGSGKDEVDRFKESLRSLGMGDGGRKLFLEKALPFLIAE